MKRIDSNEIRKIQLDMLDTVAQICDDNKLVYWLCGGTLLGAIRHKGFIPWDDDIDVLMPRDSYEKLKSFVGQRINDHYKIISYEDGKSCYPFMKMVDTRTEVDEKFHNSSFKTGVWIDIFVTDGCPAEAWKIWLRYKRVRFWRTMLQIKFAEPGQGSSKLAAAVKTLLIPFGKLFSYKFVCKRMDKLSAKTAIDKSPFVAGIIWGYGPQEKMPRSFLEQVDVEFEGKTYKAPKEWDYYLSSLYGDYMKLPPVEKQIRHDFVAYWKD